MPFEFQLCNLSEPLSRGLGWQVGQEQAQEPLKFLQTLQLAGGLQVFFLFQDHKDSPLTQFFDEVAF